MSCRCVCIPPCGAVLNELNASHMKRTARRRKQRMPPARFTCTHNNFSAVLLLCTFACIFLQFRCCCRIRVDSLFFFSFGAIEQQQTLSASHVHRECRMKNNLKRLRLAHFNHFHKLPSVHCRCCDCDRCSVIFIVRRTLEKNLFGCKRMKCSSQCGICDQFNSWCVCLCLAQWLLKCAFISMAVCTSVQRAKWKNIWLWWIDKIMLRLKYDVRYATICLLPFFFLFILQHSRSPAFAIVYSLLFSHSLLLRVATFLFCCSLYLRLTFHTNGPQSNAIHCIRVRITRCVSFGCRCQ